MSGVCHSVVKGVEGIIEKAKVEFNTPDFQLFITGGYAKFFMNISSLNFIYVDDLVFRGMECVSL